jgi:hypothetical protein
MPNDPTMPTVGRQPRLRAFLDDLAGAHATATPTGNEVRVDFGSSLAAISLHGRPDAVRLLLTDAVAQIDAIETSR